MSEYVSPSGSDSDRVRHSLRLWFTATASVLELVDVVVEANNGPRSPRSDSDDETSRFFESPTLAALLSTSTTPPPMPDQHSGHCADDCHDHDHDHSALGLGAQGNLYAKIDHDNVIALNALGAGRQVIKPWHERTDETIVCPSSLASHSTHERTAVPRVGRG